MNIELIASASAAGLLVGMLVLSEVGRRIGSAGLARDPEGQKGTGSAAAAVFGLLGLLIAFTFSGAASRFEARRHLITEEANAIGTAYLRLDLLPHDAQPELRSLFRRYVELRAGAYQQAANPEANSSRLHPRRPGGSRAGRPAQEHAVTARDVPATASARSIA